MGFRFVTECFEAVGGFWADDVTKHEREKKKILLCLQKRSKYLNIQAQIIVNHRKAIY